MADPFAVKKSFLGKPEDSSAVAFVSVYSVVEEFGPTTRRFVFVRFYLNWFNCTTLKGLGA